MSAGMPREIVVAGRRIGDRHPPFVVAELSGNHNGSLPRALEIVDAAAAAGADALKLQTYTADTMTLPLTRGEFSIRDPRSLWKGKSLYRLYREAHTPWSWHKPIFDRCRKRGLIPFSTPFDRSAVSFLRTLNAPAFKIASFENVDLALIRAAAATGRPLIISTGMATLSELDDAVRAARGAGCEQLVLLKCTSAYPAPARESHLRTLPHLREAFRCLVGLSDHTLGVGTSVAAVALGATVLERHLTLSRKDGGVDAAFSLEPDELKRLVREARTAWEALGGVRYGPTRREEGSLVFRRSLYVTRAVKKDDVFDRRNVRAIRPGLGLPPKHLDAVLGRRAGRDIAAGSRLRWKDLA
jgi:N-acetylneuraminate synthase